MKIKIHHIMLAAAVIMVAGASAAAIWFVAGAEHRELKKALNPGTYGTVCVVSEISAEDMNSDAEQEGGEQPDETDGYYLDEEGNLILPGDENDGYPLQTDGEESSSFETVVTMKRTAGIVHEIGISGEYYFFEENNNDFVIYLDTSRTMDGTGIWVKAPLINFNLKPLFDPAVLTELSPKDFVRQSDGLAPASGQLERIFHALLGTSDANRDKYLVHDLLLTVEDNRIQTLKAVYDLGGQVLMTQIWRFSYEEFSLTLPQPQEEYTGSEVE